MAETMLFATRGDFRKWLAEHCRTSPGVWLTFGKRGGPKTLSANDALEEALCFGWIDGQLRRVDDVTYQKYLAPRRPKSDWSAKNIALVAKLEADGLMTEHGRAKIEEARRDGLFQPKQGLVITDTEIAAFVAKVQGHEPAYTNLMKMPPSVHKTYTAYSLDVKSEEMAAKRLDKILGRLDQNLRPM